MEKCEKQKQAHYKQPLYCNRRQKVEKLYHKRRHVFSSAREREYPLFVVAIFHSLRLLTRKLHHKNFHLIHISFATMLPNCLDSNDMKELSEWNQIYVTNTICENAIYVYIWYVDLHSIWHFSFYYTHCWHVAKLAKRVCRVPSEKLN